MEFHHDENTLITPTVKNIAIELSSFEIRPQTYEIHVATPPRSKHPRGWSNSWRQLSSTQSNE